LAKRIFQRLASSLRSMVGGAPAGKERETAASGSESASKEGKEEERRWGPRADGSSGERPERSSGGGGDRGRRRGRRSDSGDSRREEGQSGDRGRSRRSNSGESRGEKGQSGDRGRSRRSNSGDSRANEGRSGDRRGRPRRSQQRSQDGAERSHQEPVAPVPRVLADMGDWEAPESPAEKVEGTSYFQEMGLHPRILRAILSDLGFEACTPIQGKALPVALAGRDVAGRAQTGTGKTAAFLITILQRYLAEEPGTRAPNQPFALIIAPTRELAMQIERDAEGLAPYTGARHLAVFGGLRNYKEDRTKIAQGVDIIAATPGRLLDYMSDRTLDLSAAEVLVIDEADRMLDMGFIPDVRRICSRLKPAGRRQTLLFSATLSPEILRLGERWMLDPVTVEVDPEHVVADGVEEVVYAVSSREKLAVLLWLLANETCSRVLIFRNRRRDVEDLTRHLGRHGIDCSVLTGDVPQNKRTRVLESFREGSLRVIVATDVAGRGIHVEGISHVINYDLPYEAPDYVHRIGRTGRAGESGRAISFACEERSFVVPEIEEFIERGLPIQHPDPEMLVLPPPKHDHPAGEGAHDGVGHRDSKHRRRPQRRSGGPRGRGSRGPRRG